MHKARDLNVKGKNGKMTVSYNENEKTVCINLLCISILHNGSIRICLVFCLLVFSTMV